MKTSDVGAKVENLQQQGIQVEFLHYRQVLGSDEELHLRRYYRNGKGKRKTKRPVSPTGGQTTCQLTNPAGRKILGLAVFERSTRHSAAFVPRFGCQDLIEPVQFCYAIGRAVSLGRAVKKLQCVETDTEV